MTISVNLGEHVTAALKARAEAEGCDVEACAGRILADSLEASSPDRGERVRLALERMASVDVDAEAAYRFIEEGRSEVW